MLNEPPSGVYDPCGTDELSPPMCKGGVGAERSTSSKFSVSVLLLRGGSGGGIMWGAVALWSIGADAANRPPVTEEALLGEDTEAPYARRPLVVAAGWGGDPSDIGT